MLESGWLNINKPVGYTSAQIVNILKRKLHCKKIGHGGTLDPFASGVLPVCVNEGTKTVEYVMDHSKTYLFHLTFGKMTDSFDIEGNIIEENGKIPNLEDIINILPQFVGKIQQTPPIYSAIKINGSRACDLVRNGKEVTIESREVNITNLKFNRLVDKNTFEFIVDCGRGCYIRSLGIDIAKSLGKLAYISKLTRLQVGGFNIINAIDIRNFDNITKNSIIDIDSILNLPSYSCTEEEYNDLKNGKIIINNDLKVDTLYKVKFKDQVVSISNRNNNILKSVKWFNI